MNEQEPYLSKMMEGLFDFHTIGVGQSELEKKAQIEYHTKPSTTMSRFK